MPLITFTVDMKTGQSQMHIEGISGAGCEPIHAAINADLEKALNLKPTTTTDTFERDQGGAYAAQPTMRIGW